MKFDHRYSSAALAICALVGLSSWSASARADDVPGAVRIGADLHVLNVRHYPDFDVPDPPDPTVQIGVYNAVGGIEEYMYFAPQLGFLVTDSLVIGLHVGLGVMSFLGSDPGFGIHIVPFLEYLFGTGEDSVRPFIGAQVGPRIFALPDTGFADNVFVSLIAGGLGGVHVFLDPAFSVSPFIGVDFIYNSAIERAAYEILLGISLEGWVGGG